MISNPIDARFGMRSLLVVLAVGVWTGSVGAQLDVPPPEDTDLICIQADPPVIVPDAAQLAAQIAAFEAPKGLSVKQAQRLSQVAHSFRAGRDQLALQQWGAAVIDAVQTVGARNLADRDIQDLIMIVLRQSLADRADALRLLIAQIEHVNAQKAELRDYVNDLRNQQADLQQCTENCDAMTQAEVDLELAGAEDALDSLGDITQEQQRKLQAKLDALSQIMSIVTNVLAKMSDTAQKIVASLK